jgi:hypothetical protein
MTRRAATILLLAVLTAGCYAGRQVADFKKAAEAGNYAAIAAQEVTCTPDERGCNQAHLIKGDACFRLANAGDGSHWDCAIQHLALGLDMTAGTATPIGSTQPYAENLLEALRQRCDTARSHAEAVPFTAQLERWAQAFRRAFPMAPAGYYYLASVQLTRACEVADPKPELACRALKEAQRLLASAPAEHGRYATHFHRLEADIGGLKSTLRGCL